VTVLYLFIYRDNDWVNSKDPRMRNYTMIINIHWGRLWKEAFVFYFRAVNIFSEAEETHENSGWNVPGLIRSGYVTNVKLKATETQKWLSDYELWMYPHTKTSDYWIIKTTEIKWQKSLCLFRFLLTSLIRTNWERTLVQISESPNYKSTTENMFKEVINRTSRLFLGNATLFSNSGCTS
jgi:hypothetical protein